MARAEIALVRWKGRWPVAKLSGGQITRARSGSDQESERGECWCSAGSIGPPSWTKKLLGYLKVRG